MSVKLHVLYFAKVREVVGKTQETVELAPPATAAALHRHLVARYPQLETVLRTSLFAINQEYAHIGEDVLLRNGDEVALIPPLSGG